MNWWTGALAAIGITAVVLTIQTILGAIWGEVKRKLEEREEGES